MVWLPGPVRPGNALNSRNKIQIQIQFRNKTFSQLLTRYFGDLNEQGRNAKAKTPRRAPKPGDSKGRDLQRYLSSAS